MKKELIKRNLIISINLILAFSLAIALVLPGTGLIKQSLPIERSDCPVSKDSKTTIATVETPKGSKAPMGPESMLPDAHPVTANISWLVQALPVQTSNHFDQNSSLKERLTYYGLQKPKDFRKSSAIPAAAQVSPLLGRQFTILGCKPSGTS